jgi:autotransporter-associated beta strand protein
MGEMRLILMCGLAGCLLAGTALALPDQLSVTVTNPNTGAPRVLDLQRYNLRASNYHVRIYSDATNYTVLPPAEIPEVTTYRGRIAADPEAMVVGAFTPAGRFVYLVTYGCREVNKTQMDPYDTTNRVMWGGWGTSVQTTNLPAVGTYTYAYQTNMPQPVAFATNLYPASTPSYGGPPRFNYLQRVPAQRVRMIQDMSRECFLSSCASNIAYAILMQESRMNEMDYLEARDFGICYQLVAVCIRPSTEAPFSSGNTRLSELRSYWQADPGWSGDHVQNTNGWFDMVHGTMNLGGGVAYAPGCYAITDPGFNGNVQAHEVGHNWGAGDNTSFWDYTGENRWHWTQTGSGYGHSTEMANRALGIRRSGEYYKSAYRMEWVKYNSPVAPWATPDFATTTTGQAVSVNVLVNDFCVNSSALAVVSFETNTPGGGTVANLGGGLLQYTPAAGFTGYDWFHYYVGEGTGLKSLSEAHVRVENPGNPLLAQWSFDQTNGSVLAESTGRGVAGALKGTADFASGAVAGINGSGALHLDGGGYVQFPGRWFDPLNGAWALSVWVKPDATPASDQVLFSKSDRSGAAGLFLAMNGSSFYMSGAMFGGTPGFSVSAAVAPQAGTWYHVVAAIDRSNNQARLWVNGVEYTGTSNTRSVPAGDYIFGEAPPALGGCPGRGYYLAGALDEVRLFSRALSQAEVASLYVGGGLLGASGPNPADGEDGVALQPTLAWTPGRTNYQHDVYFGTSLAAVAAAGLGAPEYRGRLTTNAYAPGVLASNTTHYWRIDEVQGGSNIAAGVVWRFTTARDALHGGLRLHLTLDDRDVVGTVAYDSAGPPFHDGTLYNGPTQNAGRVGTALDFNGTSSYIGLGNPSALNFAGRITLAAWVRPLATDGLRNILMHGHRTGPSQELGLRISAGQYQVLAWNGADHSTSFAVPPGDLDTWVHLAGCYDGTVWRLYRNGVQVGSRTDAVGAITVSENWAVGARGTGTERFFKGGIDDVMIWNRALGGAEIGLLYSNGLAGAGIDGPPAAPAPGTFTWTGNADSFWTNAANWSAGAVPGAADTAIFDASSAHRLATDPGAALAVQGVRVSGGLRGVGIIATSTYAITLGAGGLALTDTVATLTLNAPALLATAQTWAVGAEAKLVASKVITQGAHRLTWAVDGALTLSAALKGSGGLVKSGAGTATISANQGFSGGVTVSGGTLQLNAGGWYVNPFGSYNVVTIQTGATLRTGGAHSLGVDQNQVIVNGGTLDLGAENYISGLTMAGGTVEGGDLRTWGGTMTFNASAGGATINSSLNLVGSATLNVADGAAAADLHLHGGINNSGGLTKSGAGTLLITGAGSYGGATTLSAGRLQLANGDERLPRTSALTLAAGATLELIKVYQTFNTISGAGAIELNGGALVLAPTGRVVLGSAISGQPGILEGGVADTVQTSGGLTKEGAGTLVLTNACTYRGDTYIAEGTLELIGAAALDGSSNLILDAGATLMVTGRPGGVFLLGAERTLAGGGLVRGRLTSAGTLRPGNAYAPGTLTVAGSWTQQPAARLEIDLAGESVFDRVASTGAISLAGTLAVALTNSYVPQLGHTFPIVSAAARAGTFAVTNLPGLPALHHWLVAYSATGVVLAVEYQEPPPVVRVMVSDGMAAEPGADAAAFTFERTGSATHALTVTVAVAGSATPGDDYAVVGPAVVFAAGATARVVLVTALDDLLIEPAESVSVTLLADAAYELGSPGTAQVVIADNDVPAVVTLDVTDGAASERGPDPAAFRLQRAGETGIALTVRYSVGGSATPGADYAALAGSAVIAAGATAAVVTVTPLDDDLVEGLETITLALLPDSAYVAGTVSTGTLSLADDDGFPVIILQRPATNEVYLPAGVGLVVEASVVDDGLPAPPGATTVQWSQVSGPDAVTFGTADQPTSTVTFATDGDYQVQLAASDGYAVVTTSVWVHVGQTPPAVGAAPVATPVGDHEIAPAWTLSNGVHTLASGGQRGLYNNTSGDAFHFVYFRVTGDCVVTARVLAVGVPGVWDSARAGVMIREDLSTNARSVFFGQSSDATGKYVYRTDPRSNNVAWFSAVSGFPHEVSLTRSGNTFRAHYRTSSWIHSGPTVAISMASTVLVGIAATSGTSIPTTNIFDSFGVQGDLVLNQLGNRGPFVTAGADQSVSLPGMTTLAGEYDDDGLPTPPGAVSLQWSRVRGAGSASFSAPAATSTVVTLGAGGQHRLRLTADDGEVKTFDEMLVTASALTVRVEATDPAAAEAGPDPAAFRITLDGEMEYTVPLVLELGGSATPDLDYSGPPPFYDFLPGMTDAVFEVAPLADLAPEGAETVTLTVLPAPIFVVAEPATAAVTIADTPIDQWRVEQFGALADWPEAGDEMDFDGDGWNNLAEYGLGGNPMTNDAPAALDIRLAATNLTFLYRRPTNTWGISYFVEESTGPHGDWSNRPLEHAVTNPVAPGWHEIRTDLPPGDALHLLRLRITRP